MRIWLTKLKVLGCFRPQKTYLKSWPTLHSSILVFDKILKCRLKTIFNHKIATHNNAFVFEVGSFTFFLLYGPVWHVRPPKRVLLRDSGYIHYIFAWLLIHAAFVATAWINMTMRQTAKSLEFAFRKAATTFYARFSLRWHAVNAMQNLLSKSDVNQKSCQGPPTLE